MASKIFEEALKNVPEDSRIFAKKSLDVIEQVHFLLERECITQKDLAIKLGKSESEISKWLSGLHNMTLKTVSKLEAVLNNDILITPIKAEKKYKSVYFVQTARVKYVSLAYTEESKIDAHFKIAY